MEPLTPAKEKSCALIRWESAKPSRRAEFMEAKRLIWICPRVAQVIEKGANDEKDMRGYFIMMRNVLNTQVESISKKA